MTAVTLLKLELLELVFLLRTVPLILLRALLMRHAVASGLALGRPVEYMSPV